MMIAAMVMDILLAALALGMVFSGKFGVTRQMGLVPLAAALMDLISIGKIDAALTPVLAAVLLGLQAVLVLGGAFLLYQDRVRAQNKANRRARRREMFRCRMAFERRAARAARAAEQVCA